MPSYGLLFNRLFGPGDTKQPLKHITGPLWGESTGDRWIHITKVQERENYVLVILPSRIIIHVTGVVPMCKSYFASHGIIESPSYPSNYTNGFSGCVAHIHAPAETETRIRFHVFDVNGKNTCVRDYMKVVVMHIRHIIWLEYNPWNNMTSSKWKHFPCNWHFVRGIHRSSVNSPYKLKASDAELWSVLWSAPEQTVGQTIETSVIWDAIALLFQSQWAKWRKRLIIVPFWFSRINLNHICHSVIHRVHRFTWTKSHVFNGLLMSDIVLPLNTFWGTLRKNLSSANKLLPKRASIN